MILSRKLIMCKSVQYTDVQLEIRQHLKNRTLIPILGSGFSRGSVSRLGTVPSGEEYKKYMINQISCYRNYDVTEISKLEGKNFSEISTIYHKLIPAEIQRKYLRNNFTRVILSDIKKQFLNIDWPYIYTLNTDDAIENNSRYNNVVYSNRKIYSDIFDEEKCTIKLHGHVNDILSYEDSKCEIFDRLQYAYSIRSNRILLDKLRHDYEYLNLIYVGCGLSNEVDILATIAGSISNGSHYYCTVEEPNEDEKLLLSEYGITHCVLFPSYDLIYSKLYEWAKENEKIAPSEIDNYKTCGFSELTDGFETNKAYLFHGKKPIDPYRRVVLPNFFISRDITGQVIKNIQKNSTQILVGPGCSGKTYVVLDIARKVVDRDVFVFLSSESINNDAFSMLIEKKNCLVIADSKSLSVDQIETIIRTDKKRHEYTNSFVIVENKSNRDLISLLSLLKMEEVIKDDELQTHELKNRFSSKEVDILNIKLLRSSLGIFSNDKSIADNIIDISSRLVQKNKFEKIMPKVDSVKDMACLIALATLEKVYSQDVVILNLEEEFVLQKKKAFPLIEDEGTWDFEKSASKNSPMKYVVNAEYWLYNQLDAIAKNDDGREKIIESYRYIVSKLIDHYGIPDIKQGDKKAAYKDFILFDNINQIFSSQGTDLIRGIYETLNRLLSTDPNYLHQRAKCYLRSAFEAKNIEQKKKWLSKAHRDAVSSNKIFEQRYEECKNEKIQISAAHTLYTVALALCHLAKLSDYSDEGLNERAIETLYLAILSPYNSIEFINKDKAYNYNNVVENIISTIAADTSLIKSDKSKEIISELIKIRMID